MSFTLRTFQSKAAGQIAERYRKFATSKARPQRYHGSPKPFYQALASITGSGKTPMLAQAVAEIRLAIPSKVEPIVIWVSKARSVVAQTYQNFIPGGKYSNLIDQFRVATNKEINGEIIGDGSAPLILTLTTGLFNQSAKDSGSLNFHQPNQDKFGGKSPWEILISRQSGGERRPLIVVYDEAHNLSEQQTILLEELEPEAYLMASATLKFPRSFQDDVITPYTSWARKIGVLENNVETTEVPSAAVVGEGLVKKHIHFDGSTAKMESSLEAVLSQHRYLASEAVKYGISPKAIYVCDTNITKGEGGESSSGETGFNASKSPMIRIWKYLKSAGIDPKTIAVYTSQLDIDNTTKPLDFNLFGKKEEDFATFQAGNYQHIIFNQSLQEGWDDPECYICYIDKSMESRIQIEQVIGRVLRQPKTTHYDNPALNTAQFFIRVDKKETFSTVVDSVKNRLGVTIPNYVSQKYSDKSVERQIPLEPRFRPKLGMIGIELGGVEGKVNSLLTPLKSFCSSDGSASGLSETSTKVVDVETGTLVDKSEWTHSHASTRSVRLRWLVSTRIRERSHRVLNIIKTDDKLFDNLVQFGSVIDHHVIRIAEDAVRLYAQHAHLNYKSNDAFEFGKLQIRPSSAMHFNNSVYEKYSGLNDLELSFARALDGLGCLSNDSIYRDLKWHRNPSFGGGFVIPLLDEGDSANFSPDFLVWHNDLVFCLDTKGPHLLTDAIRQKLYDIKEGMSTKVLTRFITKGKQNRINEKPLSEGYTVWRFKDNREYPVPVDSIDDAAEEALKTY